MNVAPHMGQLLQYRHSLKNMVILLVFAGLAGCASAPPIAQQPVAKVKITTPNPAKPKTSPRRALAVAVGMIGTPYRYGGKSPSGFDCSGLVHYAYGKVGMQTPRTTRGQYRHTRRIKVSDLQPGDLVFFAISRNRLSHVGIYAGDGRFVHAPSSGKSVTYASLDDPYWRKRLTGAGRLK